jgi:hypothetical protein
MFPVFYEDFFKKKNSTNKNKTEENITCDISSDTSSSSMTSVL